MSKPLALPISGPMDAWRLDRNFGIDDSVDPPIVSNSIALSTAGAGQVRAAATGQLGVRQARAPAVDGAEEVNLDDLPDVLPNTVTLTLRVEQTPLRANAALWSLCANMQFLRSFRYENIETATISAALGAVLTNAWIAKSGEAGPDMARALKALVNGLVDVRVTPGQRIGEPPLIGGRRQLYLSLNNADGPHSPPYVFDQLGAYVEDGRPAVDDFIGLVPIIWPLINSGLGDDAAIGSTQTIIYPYSTLVKARNERNLDIAQWRQIGQNQKALYREQLLKRHNRAVAPAVEPFRFDDIDDGNVFQIEAIAEFYANFDDPWLIGAAPVHPATADLAGVGATIVAGVPNYPEIQLPAGTDLSEVVANRHFIYLAADTARPQKLYMITEVRDADDRLRIHGTPVFPAANSGWRIALYRTVDFMDLRGTAAVVAGTTVTLDGNPDLTRVRPGSAPGGGVARLYDTIELTNDTTAGRPNQRFLIVGVDPEAGTVDLDAAPALGVNPNTPWRIRMRPTIVIVDPIGPRRIGNTATVVGGSPNVLQLDGGSVLSRVSANFDTIFLESDTARASRTYRITEVRDAAARVTVDGNPVLTSGTSAWGIPAGLDGKHHVAPPFAHNTLWTAGGPYNLPDGDHYDGEAFVVYGDAIVTRVRFSTYTSRSNAAAQNRSSVRGNRQYHYSTYRSGDDFRNFTLAVKDPFAGYDGTRENRFYFLTPVTEDNSAVNADPPVPVGPGKSEIRLHYGNRNMPGTGSAGCVVSRWYHDLRIDLQRIYDDERREFGLNPNPHITGITAAQQPAAEIAHNNPGGGNPTDADWNDLFIGVLWIIRPEERPL